MQNPMKLTLQDFQSFKSRGEVIAMVTAYDFPAAHFADAAGMDCILVGDSIGNNVLGYSSTLPVTMDEIVTHCRAVTRAVSRAFVVGDMPYMSYQPSVRDAVLNAGRIMSEGGADAVKLEGGEPVLGAVRAIVGAGIPVMGHLGLTPQSAPALGGYKVQARAAAAAARLVEEAERLQDAGVFALVLEAVPAPVAGLVTERLDVPTIGIGAGPECDGQVLVMHDIFGLSPNQPPKLAKRYVDLGRQMQEGFERYAAEVRGRSFPDAAHSFTMKREELEELRRMLGENGT